MIEVQKKIKESLNNSIPFVVYRKPNSSEITAVFQNDNSINYTDDFTENGFVFVPFDGIEKSLIIQDSNSLKEIFDISSQNSFEEKEKTVSFFDKQRHIELVKKGIHFIETSDTEKVVLSRKEEIAVDNFDCIQTFKNLIASYPGAFVYQWFHPVSGLWLGATPESLIQIKDNSFNVMALASTQEYKGSLDIVWSPKEIIEHAYVVDFMKTNLHDFSLDVSNTYSVRAGNLVHLRTDIQGKLMKKKPYILPIIEKLHPTPATCGFPKESAKEFILKNEGYNREYYTGFLGEINSDSSDLYVNLRCMKVELTINKVNLFIGGGITIDSNPESEWEETVVKSKVIKKVL